MPALFAVGMFAPTADAQVVAYRYSGELQEPFGTHPAGTPFSGTFAYDNDQSDRTAGMDRGDFVATSFTLDIGSDHLVYTEPGVINIYDASFYPTDLFHFYTPEIAGEVGGVPVYVASLVLQDLDGEALADANLPAVPLKLSAFTSGNASFLELQGEPSQDVYEMVQIARGEFDVFEPACGPEEEDLLVRETVFKQGCFESEESGGCAARPPTALSNLCESPEK